MATFGEFLDSKAFGIIAMSVLGLSAFLSVILAAAKGRHLAWCVGCVLFPPLLLVLLRLPPTARAGQIECRACGFWNPLRRDTCARCKMDLDDSTAIE